MKNIVVILCSIFGFLLFLLSSNLMASVSVEPYDGIYRDDFAINSGLSSKNNVDVKASSKTLTLTNTEGKAIAPFNSNGYAVTQSVIPSSVVKWGYFKFKCNLPHGTLVKIQVLDSADAVYSDAILPGNSAGFTVSPIDLTHLPVLIASDKPLKLRFKIILSTKDPNVTPSVDYVSLSWASRSLPEPIPLALGQFRLADRKR